MLVKIRVQQCAMIHFMAVRKYELKKRAERQEATRARIVQAAVDLHRTIGPARTSVSAIAERAGVQRHTYYRYFPDDRALGMACSGLYMAQNPLPDPEPWRAIADPAQRLTRGLDELYAYFERNESMLTNVTRDSEIDPVFAEISQLRFGPSLEAIAETLAKDLVAGRARRRQFAALRLALEFRTWRSLVRDSGLSRKDAVATMAASVRCAGSH
jgi:AcrR family transcriptional regulator